MNNYLGRFAFVKLVSGVGKMGAAFFEEGMRDNYLFEEPGEAYNKYSTGAEWKEYEPAAIDSLPVGAMFVGVSQFDSMARKYVIIAKDSAGHSVWFPLESPEDAEPVIQIYEVDSGTQNFKPVFRSEISGLDAKIKVLCEPGKFYLCADINGNMECVNHTIPSAIGYEPIEEDDDFDDDEELTPEEQEVLDRLNDNFGGIDDDDDDDEEEDITTAEAMFMCFMVEGEKRIISVASGLQLETEIADIERRIERINNEHKEIMEMLGHEYSGMVEARKTFDADFKTFMDASKMDLLAKPVNPFAGNNSSIDPFNEEKEEVIEPESDVEEIVIEPIKDEEEPEPDSNEHHHHIEMKVMPASEDMNRDDLIPRSSDQLVIKPVDVTPSEDPKADPDGDEIPSMGKYIPKDYDESEPSEPFGADDSKFDGPAEYDTDEVDEPKWEDNEAPADDEPEAKPEESAKGDFGDW